MKYFVANEFNATSFILAMLLYSNANTSLAKLKKVGGQNPIEAAKLGCKIYHGPYTYNFRDVYEQFKSLGFTASNVEKYTARLSLKSSNDNVELLGQRIDVRTGAKGAVYFMNNIEKDKKYFKVAQERINKVKKIEDDYLDTLENNKSKPRIPFGSLVELGIIKPGTILFDPDKKINVKIMADGSIKYKESEGSIHKVAAKIMGAESCNGWTYWHYNFNGATVLIDSLRQKFISDKQV